MAITRPALNAREPMADKTGRPTFPFLVFMRGIREDLDLAPSGFNPVSHTAENSSIATTSLPTDGDLSAGLYRVTFYARITTAAGVSSSLTVNFGWTDGAVSQTHSGAAMTGNTTTTWQTGSILIYVDAATPITYSTTYASNAAGAMFYQLFVTLERMAAL